MTLQENYPIKLQTKRGDSVAIINSGHIFELEVFEKQEGASSRIMLDGGQLASLLLDIEELFERLGEEQKVKT